MASTRLMALASVTVSALATEGTPAQGALDSAGAGITGGRYDTIVPLFEALTFSQGTLAILYR